MKNTTKLTANEKHTIEAAKVYAEIMGAGK